MILNHDDAAVDYDGQADAFCRVPFRPQHITLHYFTVYHFMIYYLVLYILRYIVKYHIILYAPIRLLHCVALD